MFSPLELNGIVGGFGVYTFVQRLPRVELLSVNAFMFTPDWIYTDKVPTGVGLNGLVPTNNGIRNIIMELFIWTLIFTRCNRVHSL